MDGEDVAGRDTPLAVQESDWLLVPSVREGKRVAAPIYLAIN